MTSHDKPPQNPRPVKPMMTPEVLELEGLELFAIAWAVTVNMAVAMAIIDRPFLRSCWVTSRYVGQCMFGRKHSRCSVLQMMLDKVGSREARKEHSVLEQWRWRRCLKTLNDQRLRCLRSIDLYLETHSAVHSHTEWSCKNCGAAEEACYLVESFGVAKHLRIFRV